GGVGDLVRDPEHRAPRDQAGAPGSAQPRGALSHPAPVRRGLGMRIPTATYRLQFGDEMGFARARRLVPYLEAIGVSDVYASPLLAARPGTSGYHVTDPTRLDPSLGGRDAFESLVREL